MASTYRTWVPFSAHLGKTGDSPRTIEEMEWDNSHEGIVKYSSWLEWVLDMRLPCSAGDVVVVGASTAP